MTEVSDTTYDAYLEGLATAKEEELDKACTSRGRPGRST